MGLRFGNWRWLRVYQDRGRLARGHRADHLHPDVDRPVAGRSEDGHEHGGVDGRLLLVLQVSNPTVAALDTTLRVSAVDGSPASAAATIGPGDVVTYSVTVNNTGGSMGTTTVFDAVPAE